MYALEKVSYTAHSDDLTPWVFIDISTHPGAAYGFIKKEIFSKKV